jgi:hypothetical protein
MTITATAIGGSKGSGKSTLMLEIINRLGGLRAARRIECDGGVRALEFEGARTVILGDYGALVATPGTDSLSKASVAPCEGFITRLHARPDRDAWRILFEGDRLVSFSFLTALRARSIPVTIYLLDVPRGAAITHRLSPTVETMPSNRQLLRLLRQSGANLQRIKKAFAHTVLENCDGSASFWASIVLGGITAET